MFFIDYCRTIFWALILYLFVQAPIQNIRHLAMDGKQEKPISSICEEIVELELAINNNNKA